MIAKNVGTGVADRNDDNNDACSCKDVTSPDVLKLTSQVGYSLAGEIGREAFAELEFAYATKLLPRFGGDHFLRTNQNILLYWQFAYYKSTILRVFSESIPESLKTVDITSMTLEKIFGSIDEKKKHIIEPAFTNDVHFVVISELTSLLGQREIMRQFVNLMNAVLEGEKVTRQTLKLGRGEILDDELTELRSKGVFYDSVRGELSYTPDVCILAATRPLDNRYFTHLNKSGHFSRYHVIQHHVTAEEASEHLHKDFKLDQEALVQLKTVNQRLSNIKVSKALRPSESFMKPVYDDLEALVRDELVENTHLKLADIINPRLKDDVIRELVAHAFLRTSCEDGFKNIDELQYTQEDLDFVQSRVNHFVDFIMDPLIAEEFTYVSQRKSKKETVMQSILEFLRDGKERSRQEIVSHVLSKVQVSIPTIDNALRELTNNGAIRAGSSFGVYIVNRSGGTCSDDIVKNERR